MKKILEIMFSRRKLVVTIFTLILAYGIYSYVAIPKQEMPEIDTPYMVLSITAPGVSATEIESNIVYDIEKMILTYQDVLEVRSFVYDNFTVIYVLYSYNTDDPDRLSEIIFNRINELELSDNITNIDYGSNFDDPHVIFAVYSDSLTELELKQISNNFKNELMLIDEVGTVNVQYSFDEEVLITLDTSTLQGLGLTITDIYNIIYANSLNIPLGGINTIYGTISVSGKIEYDDLSTLTDLIIIPEIPTISPEITLGDISEISFTNISDKEYLFNDNKAVFISVFFEKDIDFTKMGDEILESKENFLRDEDNASLAIDEMLFLPDYVNAQINNVFYSLLIAIGVVMIVVLIGIGFRNSLLIVATIPVIIFGTIAILYLAHLQLHKLTIVGLIVAIGILVDNQIVITEGIKSYIDQGVNRIEAAKKGIHDNFAPILSSTLTTIAAFIVLVMLPGFLGEIVSSMPLTVIITISLSYIVSMILSPVIATIFLKKSKKEITYTSKHKDRIKRMIAFTIKIPYVWIVVSIVLLGGSIYLAFTNQPLDLYPNDERSVFYIDFESDTLGDITTTKQLHNEIVNTFVENPHILNYSSSIGGDLPNFHFSAEIISDLTQFGRIYVNNDYNEADLLAYVKELEDDLKEIDTAKITVNILELSPPIAPVRLTISAKEIEDIDAISNDIYTEIIELESVKSYNIISNIKSPKYLLIYDFDEMASNFITKAQIDQVIAINLNGYDLDISTYTDQVANLSINSDIDDISDILLLSVHSDVLDLDLPLSTFITVNQITDYSVINRFNNSNVTYIDLYFSDTSNVVELRNEVENIVDSYDTSKVKITYGGENEMFEEIGGDLIKASIIAIILIYIIMFVQFNNFVKPLIVFLTIPLSFTGSFLFLIIMNSPITATALVGMVSLIGVTVNTGILLVEYITRNHQKGEDVKDACTEAVFLRFRAIMLTSITTILGLIPLLISGGNFFRPLAITFMGGMITSTIITIFLVPSVYSMIYSKKQSKIEKVTK